MSSKREDHRFNKHTICEETGKDLNIHARRFSHIFVQVCRMFLANLAFPIYAELRFCEGFERVSKDIQDGTNMEGEG